MSVSVYARKRFHQCANRALKAYFFTWTIQLPPLPPSPPMPAFAFVITLRTRFELNTKKGISRDANRIKMRGKNVEIKKSLRKSNSCCGTQSAPLARVIVIPSNENGLMNIAIDGDRNYGTQQTHSRNVFSLVYYVYPFRAAAVAAAVAHGQCMLANEHSGPTKIKPIIKLR